MPPSAIMDNDTCNVIYVDRNVYKSRLLGSPAADLHETGDLRANLKLLLNAFGRVHVCTNGAECIEKLAHLHDTSKVELKPTLILIDTPQDAEPPEATRVSRDLSPCSKPRVNDEEDDDPVRDLYGIGLLEKIVYETHLRSLSKLVVPIPVVRFSLLGALPSIDGTDEEPSTSAYAGYPAEAQDAPNDAPNDSSARRGLLQKCLDSGAVDVMASPLHVRTLTTLEVHAYRAHKEVAKDQQSLLEIRRGRKRSWVGVYEEKPFAYLREAMVSGLMGGICRSGEESESRISTVRIDISSKRRVEIEEAPGKWHFCAPCFDDDSLLIAATLMFEHALAMPELEKWRLHTDQLTTFLVACRAAYNQFVPYHNFRHAVDVLQATFDFLIHIGVLPPYPCASQPLPTSQKSPITSLLTPFEALTLLVSAIGHDVGHPGVNNGFLVVLNAPLAQLYNDRSVLESFHCAAYSQILRRHWPRVFEDTKMRTLMISSILATDMGLHFDYMTKLAVLQEKLKSDPLVDEWPARTLDEQRALVCSLLIKCADISNVARRYDAALQWMNILCDEFSRQATMEKEIGIPSSLISPPKKDFMSLAQAQLGFVKLFAIPLFQGVAEILPQMEYTVLEVEKNTHHFEKAVEKIPGMAEETRRLYTQLPLDADIMKLVEGLAMEDEYSPIRTGKAGLVSTSAAHAEMKEASSAPPEKLSQVPAIAHQYKEISGITTSFENVAEFAASDPFHAVGHDDRFMVQNGKQRSSDTTEGSNSVPCSGDWHSQATSATTGKMPLSPSTQGTSIVSQDSVERPSSDPTTAVTAPDSSRTTTPIAVVDSIQVSEEESNGTLKPDGTLKKKTSRFRMNVSTFFRRNKSGGSPASGGSGN
ncbi:hypothetical protein O1611_g5781 [Lasiodiplodia mahajangana]|uniref:Uncharacterized protein n=1 Tax=Lasiodiplodia mahajangana TaxID=1108764 RepID=A0ACC2JKB3_9PEZI|nr:hypothetical protein O1611_g5781 [Lasiodiplodia mahajangana]